MKILGSILFVLIASLQYRIWWGEGSVREIRVLSEKINEQKALNELLQTQNDNLAGEILAIRKHPELLEEIAREKLGLIKPNETFYRIIPKEEIQ